jgi:hypothetical protein
MGKNWKSEGKLDWNPDRCRLQQVTNSCKFVAYSKDGSAEKVALE